MNVLFLSAWYPHRDDAMWGLFVRKHAAAAASMGMNVHVLYAAASDSTEGGTEYVRQEKNGVTEHYGYYRKRGRGLRALTAVKAYTYMP